MRGLQEVVPIQDTLCHGIGKIEFLDEGQVRIWLFVLQETEDEGEKEKIVVAKIVGSKSGIPEVLRQLVEAFTPRTLSMVPFIAGLMMN